MSASEKLKALPSETEGAAALIGIPLPHIVAVVEAAEKQNGWLPTSDVSRALTALEEALK